MFKGKKKLNSLTKIHFKNEGKIKTFPGKKEHKHKPEEYVCCRPAL